MICYFFSLFFFDTLAYSFLFFFFFFNDTATTEIYTLSLHDALPISFDAGDPEVLQALQLAALALPVADGDRKSTRLNSSHGYISYAVFCLKKKKKKIRKTTNGIIAIMISRNLYSDISTEKNI